MSEFLPSTQALIRNRRPQQQACRHYQEGITLFELITVVCLISVITGFGLLSFDPLWKKHQLKLASTDFKGKIQLYRMKAILKNTTYQIRLNNNILYVRNKEGESWSDWRNLKLRDKISYSFAGNIYFYQKGFASPKTMTLGFGDYNKKLILNINGRVRESEIY